MYAETCPHLFGTENQRRYQEVHDPEIASRIANYELANRMQSAAPELVDLSGRTRLLDVGGGVMVAVFDGMVSLFVTGYVNVGSGSYVTERV